jgi:hypothetical protein
MPIKIFNHTKLTQRPFFQSLIDFLASHDEVTLRQIKATFPDEKNLERQIEDFVQAGLTNRCNKRYSNAFHVFDDKDFDRSEAPAAQPEILVFDHPFFVAAESQLVGKLENSWVQQTLANTANQITLHFSSNFKQTTDNLANYFSHVANDLPLSALEQEIYQIIGDVNPDYALKYMTTCLLKFAKKDVVKQKRPDIFVRTLELYGYIDKIDEENYRCQLTFDDCEFETIIFDNAREFIAAQIKQNMPVANFVKLGEKI